MSKKKAYEMLLVEQGVPMSAEERRTVAEAIAASMVSLP